MVETTKSGKPIDPIEMLKEIEAYLTFKLLDLNPTIPISDMQLLKNDLNECLLKNGHDVNFKANK